MENVKRKNNTLTAKCGQISSDHKSKVGVRYTRKMDSLWWVWTKELYVFNGTKHVIQVELGDSNLVCALDIG